MSKSATLQSVAESAREHFTLKTRDDGAKFWSYDHHTTPEWVQAMCREAHGDMFPDDHKYAFVVEALDAFEECDDPDDVTAEADVYTSDLMRWVASHGDRQGYCDEAAEEHELGAKVGLVERLQYGQAAEKDEVFGSVRSSLEERLSELEDEGDDEPDGPEEGDLTTEDFVSFHERSATGRGAVVEVAEGQDWREAVRAYQDGQQFWGNVWRVSDHGNVELVGPRAEEAEGGASC